MLLGANVFRARRRDDGGACRADCALFSSQGTLDQHSRSARWRWRWPSSRLTSADSCSKPASAGCCVSKSSAAEALSLREAMRDGRPAADVGAFLQNRQPGRSHPSLPYPSAALPPDRAKPNLDHLDILLFQDEARVRSHSSRRYSSTKTSPTLSPPRRPSASITRFDHRSTCAFSRGRPERMSFIASRSLLPSGQGKSVRFLPDTIH
jgi:hypothetical protein